MSETKKESSDVLVLERVFRAPPEKVFEAFSGYEAMKQWFGPEGCGVVDGEADFREGGKYRLTLSLEEGGTIDLVGVYQTIERPDHLAFSWRWEKNDNFNPCESFVEIIFQPHDGGTLLRLVQTGIDEKPDRENHVIGWTSTFNKLEKLLS